MVQRDRASGAVFFRFFLHFETNTSLVLPSDAVAMEVASHAERGTWDLWRVREWSEWMRDDAFFEVLVGRVFVISVMKFAEMACKDPATTAAVDDSTVLRTPRRQ